MENDESASKLVKGYRIFYNFIRPHQALNGKTPAEMIGINLNLGKNQWKDFNQTSLYHPKVNSKA
ncbi:MAG: hypothetical protein QXW32_04145 [Nitrososphaerales archaeon]